MEFQNTLDFALQQDAQDILRSRRNEFHFPQHQGRDVVYLTGNSLGLQPVGAMDALKQECEDWQRFGVEGHFHAQHPWYSYHERFTHGAAQLVGAKPTEVVMMNQLTVNLHLLLMSFYRPSQQRRKILFEHKPFPSDHYAFASQAQLHGFNPQDVLVEMQPRTGEVLLREEDILVKIHELGDELALVCFGGVNYFTGQFFPMQKIVQAAHEVGAYCGFDLAHTAGNLPLKLHEWDVDFACWCTYKYLNSGPGSVGGAYVHERFSSDTTLFRLAGWWGQNKSTRFQMGPDFSPIPTAESWAMSNAPVFNMAIHAIALQQFTEVGMEALRVKSIQLTAYLAFVLQCVAQRTGVALSILTPQDPEQRGCQLSVVVPGATRKLVTDLAERGSVVDWREPNVIRMAPVPMYNSFEDVYQFGEMLSACLLG
ncbi:MAG: kynureninase [Flavobacteriales bacterium]